MICTVNDLIAAVQADLLRWETTSPIGRCTPWFRGEAGDSDELKPRLFQQNLNENLLLQTFRRQAGGLVQNPPAREKHRSVAVPRSALWRSNAIVGLD